MIGKPTSEKKVLYLATFLVFASALLFLNYYRAFFPPLRLLSAPSSTSKSTSASPAPLSSPATEAHIEQLLHPQDHKFREPTELHYHWDISKGLRAPDGVQKSVYLINNEFPGPTIEARVGDTLVVEVANHLEDGEGVSIHWHGLHLKGANEMDGAVGFTQCPIPPGSNFTYKFTIDDDEAGTFWYHSHSGEQTGDGLHGGLVVHQAASVEDESVLYGYDDEILLLVGDWYHQPVQDLLKKYISYVSAGAEPVPDSMLLNGIGDFDCSMLYRTSTLQCTKSRSRPQLYAERGKKYRLRVVNVGSLTGITLSVSGADLLPVQVDGGNKIQSPSESVEAIGTLYPGERVDLIVNWKQDLGTEPRLIITLDEENFMVRNLALTPKQSFPFALSPTAPAAPSPPSSGRRRLRFSARRSPEPITTAPSTFFSLSNTSATAPSSADEVLLPPSADKTVLIYTNVFIASTHDNIPEGRINRTSWKVQSEPPLPLLALDRDQWDENQFVPWVSEGSAESTEPFWVDIVINNMDIMGHPFHLHGHTFFLLSTCAITYGPTYSPFDPAKHPPRCGAYNTRTPPQKDTVYVPGRGYVVLRFHADNQGIWALHCHLLWHRAAGMAMALQVLGTQRGVFAEQPTGATRALAAQFCPT